MSAYFVSDECMQNVIASFMPCGDPTQLGRDLFDLNRQAMIARYPGIASTDEETSYIEACETFAFDGRCCDTFEAVTSAEDAVAELLYQCSEGDLPETSKLYGALTVQDEIIKERLSQAKHSKRLEVARKVSSYLEKNPANRWSTVETARFLRTRLLPDCFPGIKFRVTTRRGTIDIAWTNGPTTKQVDTVVNTLRANDDEDGLSRKFLTIDGKTVYPSLGYVFTNRNCTETFQENVKAALDAMTPDEYCKVMNRHAICNRDQPWYAMPGCAMNKQSAVLASISQITL